MNGYYSVFAPGGKKVVDCGTLQDATTLVAMKGEGHYYQFTPYPCLLYTSPSPRD